MSTVAPDVLPVILAAPTSIPEPSIGDRTRKVMGLGGSPVGVGMTRVTFTGVETGPTLSLATGATLGPTVGADSGIGSAKARMEGVGGNPISFGDAIGADVAPGPQATKTKAHTKR